MEVTEAVELYNSYKMPESSMIFFILFQWDF